LGHPPVSRSSEGVARRGHGKAELHGVIANPGTALPDKVGPSLVQADFVSDAGLVQRCDRDGLVEGGQAGRGQRGTAAGYFHLPWLRLPDPQDVHPKTAPARHLPHGLRFGPCSKAKPKFRACWPEMSLGSGRWLIAMSHRAGPLRYQVRPAGTVKLTVRSGMPVKVAITSGRGVRAA